MSTYRERERRVIDRLIAFMLLFTPFLMITASAPAQIPPPSTPIYYVDDDFNSNTPGWGVTHFAKIQDAVDQQASICLISVYPGTYYENVLIEDSNPFFGKMIHLVSRAGSASTYIDGGQNGPAVTFKGAGTMCEIKGFTINNGSGVDYQNNGTYHGGGIFCLNSTLHIRNNNIMENTADYGGGICCYYDMNYPDPSNPKTCAPTIENNTIRDNNAATGGGGICCFEIKHQVTIRENEIYLNGSDITGGGIYIHGNFYAAGMSISLVEHNSIYNNFVSVSFGTGAGLAMAGNGINTIVNNELSYNYTSTNGIGGGIYVGNKSSWFIVDQDILDRNFVHENTAHLGGGIYIDMVNYAILTNNAVSRNTAVLSGGGIYIATTDASIPYKQLTNNSVGYNSTQDPNGTGGGILVATQALGNVGIENTIIYGNTSSGVNEMAYWLCPPAVTYCDVEDPNNPGNPWPDINFTNIWANPLFTDWKFHISPTSPCKEKGNNNATYIPALDIDGEPRIYNTVDMGSDEVQA